MLSYWHDPGAQPLPWDYLVVVDHKSLPSACISAAFEHDGTVDGHILDKLSIHEAELYKLSPQLL
jgi:hypothetical protein